jgi:hypothetical protein
MVNAKNCVAYSLFPWEVHPISATESGGKFGKRRSWQQGFTPQDFQPHPTAREAEPQPEQGRLG